MTRISDTVSSPRRTGSGGASPPTEPTVAQTLKQIQGTRLHLPSNPSKSSGNTTPVSRDGLVAAVSEWNATRTIDDLHLEILFAVFEFAVDPFDPAVYNFRRLVSLTHVSRRWREVLLNSGRIWSNIHIRGQDLAMLKTQIVRCQQAPLLVSFTLPSWTWNIKEFHNVQEAMRLIRRCRNQVERLEVHMNCHTFAQKLGCEWPSLKEFVWVDTCPTGSSLHGRIHAQPANGGLPKLKSLSVEGGIMWPVIVATRLTTFKLKGPFDIDCSDIVRFFRRNTSLESLEFNNIHVSRSSRTRREKPIELPRLTKLSVNNATIGCVLPLLNAPSLKQLWVSSLGERNPWLDTDWSELCPRLAITNLEAPYEKIQVLGSKGLDTQSLQLTESSLRTRGSTLFKALAYASLSSVTSLSLINGVPEQTSSPLANEVCALLEHLPRVERLRLCPSYLALEVASCLRDDPRLCSKLRELQVTVALMRLMCIFRPVSQVVEARGGTERRLKRVECLPNGSEQERETVRVKWDQSWRDMGLDRYLDGE